MTEPLGTRADYWMLRALDAEARVAELEGFSNMWAVAQTRITQLEHDYAICHRDAVVNATTAGAAEARIAKALACHHPRESCAYCDACAMYRALTEEP